MEKEILKNEGRITEEVKIAILPKLIKELLDSESGTVIDMQIYKIGKDFVVRGELFKMRNLFSIEKLESCERRTQEDDIGNVIIDVMLYLKYNV